MIVLNWEKALAWILVLVVLGIMVWIVDKSLKAPESIQENPQKVTTVKKGGHKKRKRSKRNR